MKNFGFLLLFASMLSINTGCNGQSNSPYNLSAADFSAKLNEQPKVILLDVRSPNEYKGGHLKNSKNIDWNGDSFEAEIAKMDKKQPVFVYCQSGGRSASAAKKLRSSGFETVYEMDGGMSEWRDAKLPETLD